LKKSALLVVTMAALMAVTGVVRKPNHTEAQAGRPNVVFVLTDDQRWDALNRMPKLQAALADHGVKFTNAVVDNPWCCPSRASFLTGNRSHMTGVWNNNPYGWGRFKDGSTLATWLHSAGYRTALVGKYLNGYESKPG
jgi:arylsulfatase A-like enzyme